MSKFYEKAIKTEYKNVYKYEHKGCTYFRFIYSMGYKTTASIRYNDLRTAAINLDKLLISKGKEPINILKRK
ncbi:MAG: hypothetical protein ACRC8Z_03955 [Empedobacter falsenii]